MWYRYKVAQTVYLQTQILDKDVSSTELKLLALAARLQDAEHRVRALLQDAQAKVCYTTGTGYRRKSCTRTCPARS